MNGKIINKTSITMTPQSYNIIIFWLVLIIFSLASAVYVIKDSNERLRKRIKDLMEKELTYYHVNFHVRYLSNEEFEDYVSTHENVQIYHNPSNKIFHYKSCGYSGNRPSTLTIRVTDDNDKEICFDVKNCGIVIEDRRDKI